jgi:peptidoglycan/xylan/chitin deacetylase (PgdA/CDA1 family)
MFHHVAPRAEGSPLLWVTPRQLAAELAWLGHHGYHTVTLAQVYARWTTGSPLPVHPVVLSFDDGYLDQYRYAAPVLRHYRDVAVLNLIVDNLGRALTVADVSRMAAWGWEIDSHTITHRDLALLPARVVRYELLGSRNLLRRYLHLPIDFFCYPGGAYDAAVVRQVREAGYLAATSVIYGLARPAELFTLPRIVVFGGERLQLFGESLGGSEEAGDAIDRAVNGAGL